MSQNATDRRMRDPTTLAVSEHKRSVLVTPLVSTSERPARASTIRSGVRNEPPAVYIRPPAPRKCPIAPCLPTTTTHHHRHHLPTLTPLGPIPSLLAFVRAAMSPSTSTLWSHLRMAGRDRPPSPSYPSTLRYAVVPVSDPRRPSRSLSQTPHDVTLIRRRHHSTSGHVSI